MDGLMKKRLVINLSRWVNGFVRPDSFKMAQFQDALAQSSKGDYQSVYNISKSITIYDCIQALTNWWASVCRMRMERSNSTIT
jgi:hypothetical protein